jgi:hypothetical protein
MGLLGKMILNEGITIFKCDILIKTAADQIRLKFITRLEH